MDYLYWVVRYVPNLVRGEFVNIGVVCGRDSGDWAVQFDTQFVRVTGDLGPDLRELRSWTRWFERRIQPVSPRLIESERPVDSAWIESLRGRQASSIQFSVPSAVDAATAAEAIQLLFPHLVEREPIRRRSGVTRRTMRADVRDTLRHEFGMVVDRDLFMSPRVSIGRQRGLFDLASTRQATSLTNVWAFNVATLDTLQRDIQSWNFIVSRLRDEGARLSLGRRGEFEVGRDVSVQAIIDPPETPIGLRGDIYGAALEEWGRSGIAVETLQDFHTTPELVLS
ncbi:DUF3037 domain-containing protein [Leifsonia naganoensis]|uniref:DUF3037 domain-containing protein n=1 Tax=Leifsonia naganoensis TaxID=150025 RepID=A0A853DQD7_9MICO|nr:DUF3037 domain-containing protein [Leifsonia naganoensis]NYK08561.1 hypothetical protein [Leifsonia naganoensis]